MKDSTLQKLCREFAKESISILHSTSDMQLPMREALAVEINEDRTGYQTSSQQVPDPFSYIFRNYEKIASSTAFKSLTSYMARNEKLKKLYTKYEIERALPTTFLVKLLIDEEKIFIGFQQRKIQGNLRQF